MTRLSQFFKFGLALCLVFCLFSCSFFSAKKEKRPWRVAYDPDWNALPLLGQESRLFAFSSDLFKAIANKSDTRIQLIPLSTNAFISHMERGVVDAVLGSIDPVPPATDTLIFSEPFLKTGPVLVTRAKSNIHSIYELNRKHLGIKKSFQHLLDMEKTPELSLSYYENAYLALQQLSSGKLDATLIDLLVAYAYTQSVYSKDIKIHGPPLSQSGLRLITLKKNDPSLVELFNEQLSQFLADGYYELLLQKWSLHQ